MQIGGFQPFTLSDFPGRPAAIVFTRGCNFRCPFCHNGSLLDSGSTHEYDQKNILELLAKRVGLLQGVVVTGGEPTIHNDLPEFLARIKTLGFAVKLDTNGSRPEMLETVLLRDLVDYVAMDVKAPLHRYDVLAGTAVDTSRIQRSIDILATGAVPYEFRTTFVPALMTEQDMLAIAQLLPDGATYRRQRFIAENALSPELRQTLAISASR